MRRVRIFLTARERQFLRGVLANSYLQTRNLIVSLSGSGMPGNRELMEQLLTDIGLAGRLMEVLREPEQGQKDGKTDGE